MSADANTFRDAMGQIHRQKQDHGVDIKGKLYSKVQDRIEVFRQVFGGEYGIDTSVDYHEGFGDGAPIIGVCKITDIANGVIVASGHACEFIGSSRFTRYNPVEVAETSAIGRALAAFGLHGGEYASADEIDISQDREENDRRGFDRDEVPEDRRFVNDLPPQRGPDERDMLGRQTQPPPERRGPPQRPGSFYVPDEHDVAWLVPEREHERILQQIDRIDNVNDLGMYWGQIRNFVGILSKDSQHLAAEIKAAFATANNTLGGR